MKKTVWLWFLLAAVALLLASAPLMAKKGGDRPSGWDRGDKKGWQSDAPLGQEKKSEDDFEHKGKQHRERERKEYQERRGEGEETDKEKHMENREKNRERREERERREREETERKKSGPN